MSSHRRPLTKGGVQLLNRGEVEVVQNGGLLVLLLHGPVCSTHGLHHELLLVGGRVRAVLGDARRVFHRGLPVHHCAIKAPY